MHKVTIYGILVIVRGLYPYTQYSCKVEEYDRDNQQFLIRTSPGYVNIRTLPGMNQLIYLLIIDIVVCISTS